MIEKNFTLPDCIYIAGREKLLLLNLAGNEQREGALAFGVFGSRTVGPNGKDIDLIIVRDGIQRGGTTTRNGIFHLNYFPVNFLSDPIATFGKQAFSSAVFIFNYL